MPLTPNRILEAARLLLDHRRRGAVLAALPEPCRPQSAEDGYAIQQALIALRVEEEQARPIGWKIGATNPAAREMLGVVEPFFGILLSTLTSDAPARFTASEMFQRIVEPEIALEINTDLDPADAPFDADAIRRAVRAVLPAIEIVDTPLADGIAAGGPSLIADGGAHGRWVRGTPVAGWRDLDLIEQRVTLTVDGALVCEGRGGNVEGGPLAATAWLANALAVRGLGLKAGDFVSTGTTTQPIAATAGQSLVADFGAIGSIGLRFD